MRFSESEFAKLKDVLLVYEWSRQIVLTRLDIMRQDLASFHKENPIEHIKSRIKAPENIADKLYKLGYEITAQNAKQHLTDIIGIRIICAFAKDVYKLVAILESIPEWKIIKQKDYIANPKPGGYRSFHLIIEIPVYYSGKTENIPAEIQLRTAAMDFWATIEHKVRYKYNDYVPKHLSDELVLCADKIAELDERMLLIHEIIKLVNE